MGAPAHSAVSSRLLWLFLALACPWSGGAQVGPPTDPADTAALLAFNAEVIKASGSSIPGWFPENQTEPCGDYYSDPRVLPYPGVLCPYGKAGQTTPVNVLSLVLYETGLTATNIAPVTGLRHLTALSLIGNNFSGSLPAGLATLRSLRNIDLRDNQLSGTIPDLTGAPLATLFVSNQTWAGGPGLTGSIPAFLGTMTTLTAILLSGNSLSGSIPSGLISLPQLNTLYLRGNQLSGRIPSLAPLAGTIQSLDISRNPFARGPIPSELNSLTLLNGVLDLSYMNLEGGLVDLTDLGAVTDIILDGNFLSGRFSSRKLPSGDSSSLGYISIRNNQFSGTIPASLLRNLNNNIYCLTTCGINFANNRFTGTLPATLGDLLQAFVFDFSNNRLTGKIPNKYGYVYSMLQLKLQNNVLSGPLPDFNPPPSVSYQLSLVQLDASNNRLSGTIPEHLSRFTRLEQISLGNNRFYGTIPSFSVLTRLSYLNLSRNSLSGVPPVLPSAKRLDLNRNFLGGSYSNFSSSYSANVTVDGSLNCFRCGASPKGKSRSKSKASCAMPLQRTSKECRAFCRADSIQPPCGGHGVCYIWPPARVPSCRCEKNYTLSGGKGYSPSRTCTAA